MNIRTILHPTNFSRVSNAAFQHAVELARAHSARLLVLRAVRPCEWAVQADHVDPRLLPAAYYEQLRDDLLQLTAGETDVPIEHLLIEGDPAAAIIHTAAEYHCDLIVMGNEGTGPRNERWLFRTIPEKVLESAPCPVLLVRTAAKISRVAS